MQQFQVYSANQCKMFSTVLIPHSSRSVQALSFNNACCATNSTSQDIQVCILYLIVYLTESGVLWCDTKHERRWANPVGYYLPRCLCLCFMTDCIASYLFLSPLILTDSPFDLLKELYSWAMITKIYQNRPILKSTLRYVPM